MLFHDDLLQIVKKSFFKRQAGIFPHTISARLWKVTLLSGCMRREKRREKHLYGTRRPVGIRRSKGIRIPPKLEVQIEGTEDPLLQHVKRNYLVALYNGHAQLLATFRGSRYNHGRQFNLFVAIRQIREKQKLLMAVMEHPLQHHEGGNSHHVSVNLNPFGTTNKILNDGYTSTERDGSSVATVIFCPTMRQNWKDIQHTIQSYDYSSGEKVVLDGYFCGFIEDIKYTKDFILAWSGLGNLTHVAWRIPPLSLSVWCRKTGKLVRIIYPHENRQTTRVESSSFLNMQSSTNDRAWMTFRYTNGRYCDGFKSAILINLKTAGIERQLFGEVAGSFHDGTREYLAVHKPDTNTGDPDRNEPLENDSNSYCELYLMMDVGGRIEPMCPTAIKAELDNHPTARFDRDALRFWQNDVQVFLATQIERRLIEIYFWHTDDVSVNQTAVLKLVRLDLSALLPIKRLEDFGESVNALVVRGYLPSENRILINAECLVGVNEDDVGIAAPFIRHNFEFRLLGISDQKLAEVLRQGSNSFFFFSNRFSNFKLIEPNLVGRKSYLLKGDC